MASLEIRMKAGDTAPPFVARCLDAAGAPIPTLGATVQLRMAPQVAGLRAPILASAVWSDPAAAEATYVWLPADTAVPGLYYADLLVTYADGHEESFPDGEYVTVEILPAP